MTATDLEVTDCTVCKDYLTRRYEALMPHIREKADQRNVGVLVILRSFMLRVHARHLSGEALS